MTGAWAGPGPWTPGRQPNGLRAWPFLIGRSKYAGHRVIVAPDFLRSGQALSALASATRTVDLPDGSASLRELRGLPTDPLCVVYRCPTAAAADFGVAGDGDLVDETSRVIRLTQGLVIPRPAAEIRAMTIGRADFDHARAEVTEAYRAFWELGDEYVRRESQGFDLSGMGGEPLQLVLDEPKIYASAGLVPAQAEYRHSANQRSRPPRPTRPYPDLTVLPRPSEPPGPPATAGGAEARFPTTRTALLALLALGLVAVIVLATRGSSSPNPVPPTPVALTADATLAAFCTAMDKAQPTAAYGYMSSAFKTHLSEGKFTAELLPDKAATAKNCSYTMSGGSTVAASVQTFNAQIILTLPGGQVTTWQAVISDAPGSTWLISSLQQPGTGSAGKHGQPTR